MENDLKNEFELNAFKKETENLTEDVLKWRAFDNTKNALRNKEIHQHVQKNAPNDFVNNAAKQWFANKK